MSFSKESESRLIESSAVSSATSFEIREMIQFPGSVKKLRILDIGGGGSDATARFLAEGAEAYAIDPRYENIDELVTKVTQYNSLLGLDNERLLNERFNALQSFRESILASPDHYKAMSATNLRHFPDNYFNLVYSVNLMTAYLDVDQNVLFAAIQEALRVTRDKGTVRLFPFLKVDNLLDKETIIRLSNQNRMMDMLKKHPNVQAVAVVRDNIRQTDLLIITKGTNLNLRQKHSNKKRR